MLNLQSNNIKSHQFLCYQAKYSVVSRLGCAKSECDKIEMGCERLMSCGHIDSLCALFCRTRSLFRLS